MCLIQSKTCSRKEYSRSCKLFDWPTSDLWIFRQHAIKRETNAKRFRLELSLSLFNTPRPETAHNCAHFLSFYQHGSPIAHVRSFFPHFHFLKLLFLRRPFHPEGVRQGCNFDPRPPGRELALFQKRSLFPSSLCECERLTAPR